jgi:hypothetical protein
MARLPASVDNIRLLQDFLAWEPRKLLRKRARSIVERMEAEALQPGLQPGPGTA